MQFGLATLQPYVREQSIRHFILFSRRVKCSCISSMFLFPQIILRIIGIVIVTQMSYYGSWFIKSQLSPLYPNCWPTFTIDYRGNNLQIKPLTSSFNSPIWIVPKKKINSPQQKKLMDYAILGYNSSIGHTKSRSQDEILTCEEIYLYYVQNNSQKLWNLYHNVSINTYDQEITNNHPINTDYC